VPLRQHLEGVLRGKAMTANTSAMNSSGTSSWNRSLMLLTKIRRGLRQRSGIGRAARAQRDVEALLEVVAGMPRHRSANVSA
jgi:hypothetical protein